ncbi:hypothetical protein N7495_002636 [Penicillium taxi]|uniref:uncharacterized protein n=1 Tax=Penicillium taxi TaxID=168475 RepID=UPI00254514B4|nr:uncharacterized protein N7495_002636 [Penicillium taxi]KAJ5902108.1 hypothetical protein N7495_002636 [Penicillium taxi]
MSRQPMQPPRPLSLTEELEKLEQSITLTLQEIDHNFSQAHRIVTTSILPLVEQYTEHSHEVWNGAKFWKQFFEASANVSLSGYEERPNADDTQESTATEEELSADITQSTTTDQDDSYDTPTSRRNVHHGQADDLDLSELAISSHSTPRAVDQHIDDDDLTASSIDHSHSSDYENLRKQINEASAPFQMPDSFTLPSTPGRQHDYGAESMMSSPFIPPVSSTKLQTPSRDTRYQKSTDPVLHQMLDKTYRVQATPLGNGYYNAGAGNNARSNFASTPKQKSRYAFDDSPLSSPEPEAPKLNAELFSPVKDMNDTPGTNRKRRTSSNRLRERPTPGMSVLTPAKKYGGNSAMWDSDDDLDNEISPPKTMHFHIPQSRLMQTPAREASKRIVTDLLATAGADDDLSDDQSPSIVRRMEGLEDEIF